MSASESESCLQAMMIKLPYKDSTILKDESVCEIEIHKSIYIEFNVENIQ